MSEKNITTIESLPTDAREFVDFLKDLVTDDTYFINILFDQLSKCKNDEYESIRSNEECLSFIDSSYSGSESDLVIVREFMDNYNCKGYTGAFKLALVFEDFNYILKFPIRNFDQCEIECDNYADAIKENLEHYFVNTYNLGSLDSFVDRGYDGNIYIQKKVVKVLEDVCVGECWDFWEYGPFASGVREECGDAISDEEVEAFSCFMESYAPEMFEYVGFLFAIWKYHSADEIMELDSFLYRHNINDLHSCNAGFLTEDYNTCPVIIDFAGC